MIGTCPKCGADQPAEWNDCVCGYVFGSEHSELPVAHQDAAEEFGATSAGAPSSGLLAAGTVLMIVSALLALWAIFGYDPSVPNPSSSLLPGETEYPGTLRINNIGLLQRQQMLFELGLAGLVVGAILIAAGSLVDQLRKAANV